jgi:hypothetical protein
VRTRSRTAEAQRIASQQDINAAIDAFCVDCNTDRPHQSLDMAFPADLFAARSADERLPLRLPTQLSAAVPEPSPKSAPPAVAAPALPVTPAPLTLSSNGVDPVDLAVEFARLVPASGNLTVCGQQFWLGPDRAGTMVEFWLTPRSCTCWSTVCGSKRSRPA